MKEGGILTLEQAQEILITPLLTEALIALADKQQRIWLIGFRELVSHLFTLECLYTKAYFKETRALLIKLGVFKPEEDILPLTPSNYPQY